MRTETRNRLSAAFAATALLALAICGPVMADEAESGGETVELTGAVLRWGMTNEANNAAHAPGTWNFFSAGKIPNPGKGFTLLKEDDWDQKSGDVAIEKWDGDEYKDATWAGLSTDAGGTRITSPGSGVYSNHQIVFGSGKGTAASDGSTAHIEWDGAVSVIFYSGYSFFYLSDPVLVVTGGKGTITAKLSGYAASQTDPDVWDPVDERTVTIADLPSVSLADGHGFSATPAFDDVKVDTTSCPKSGSFPESFIDIQEDLGTAAFWCRSGSGTDDAKRALPVTVSFDASAPITPPGPEPTPTPTATTTATPTPTAGVDPSGGTQTLSGAELRWGMTNEANNAAHAPGTWNFFSAGKLPNPGKGGVAIDSDDWKQASGNVAIEKWDGSAYRKATWSGLSTDADGDSIAPASSTVYSNHQWVFGTGTGTADTASGKVHIEWDGDVSVAFYSGYTFFYLSDPVLDVSGGKGVLKATLSGYGGSRDDPSAWEPVKARTVILADLPKVSVGAKGFTATPAFGSVKVNTASCRSSGSFPKSFIEAQEDLGTAAFWCASGSSTDDAKKALPLTISFDASDPVDSDDPDNSDSDSDDVSNDAPGFTSALASVPAAVADVGRAVAEAVSFPLRLVSSQFGAGAPTLWIVGTVLWVLTAGAVAVALLRFPTPTHGSLHDDLS